MRLLILFSFLFLSFQLAGQTVLWHEDFEGESNNATTGTAGGTIGGTWSVLSLPPGGIGSFSKQSDGGENRFTVDGTGNGEGVWSSGVINIIASPEVAIEMSLVEYHSTNVQDYIRAYYRLDGGPEVLFGSIEGGGSYDITANASVILSGSSLELIVRGRENTPALLWVIPRFLRFDDISVVQIDRLYSRINGNWNSGTTWTKTPGGAACNCTPNAATHVVVRHNVAMNTSGDAVNVTVENGGTLRYTGDHNLRIHRGGAINVNAGGTINRNGNDGARIDFTWAGVTNNITINGNSSIGILSVPAAATVNFGGSANLAVSDDLLVSAPATVNFGSTGNLTVGDDFIVSSTALITNNKTGGSISISDDLSFATANATFNNNHVFSANDLVVNGSNGNTVRNNTGGTINVVTIAPSNGNLTIENYGTINQSGNFTDNSFDAGSSFNNRSTGVWNFSRVGGTNDAQITSVLNCAESGNTFNYNGAGNQSVFSIQYHHLMISTSGTKTLATNTDINGNLTIRNSASLNANNRNITLGGNWSVLNTATFTQGTATITFNGSANQSITNAAGQSFSRLVINKPAGAVNLSNDLIIADGGDTDLTLTRGNINSSSSALVTISSGATTTSGNVNSFINGPVRRIGNTPFVFPTGKNGQFARIGITPSGGNAASEFTAEYFNTPHSNLTVDGSLRHVSHAEYWTLTRAVNSPTAAVTLHWQNSFSDISNTTTDLRVARFTGTNWTSVGNAARSGPAGGPGYITSSTGISNFQAFTFASLGGINILPVELLYFKAILKNNEVELKWETASEVNNDYFTIERTNNAEQFFPVENIKSKGDSRERTAYSYIDTNPLYGRSYYRLKQTDFDGTVTYSELTFVDYAGPAFPTLSIYPNPSVNRTVTIKLDGFEKNDVVPIRVIDTKGRQLYETSVLIPDGFAVTAELELPLPRGVYIIHAGSSPYLTRRIVVE